MAENQGCHCYLGNAQIEAATSEMGLPLIDARFYSILFCLVYKLRQELLTYPPTHNMGPIFSVFTHQPNTTTRDCYEFLQHHYIMQLTQQTNRTFII